MLLVCLNFYEEYFMAIAWLTVLQTVPWTEVIKNAPKVADGAKKLWSKVASQPASSAASAVQADFSHESQTMAALGARTIALESTVSDLRKQMLASSELINALAEQNTQLIQRVELHRKRALLLSVTTVVVSLSALLAVLMMAR